MAAWVGDEDAGAQRNEPAVRMAARRGSAGHAGRTLGGTEVL